MTYKNYTLDELKTILDYNKENGVFKSRVSGKELIDRTYSYRDVKTKKVVNFQLARVAYMLGSDEYLDENDRITYKDGDVYNLTYSNLVVVPYNEVYLRKHNSLKNTYLETEEDHIFVGTMNGVYVVRRDKHQAVYKTYSKAEAIAVRDRWLESGKTLHEIDDSYPKWYREAVKLMQST